MDEAAGCCDAMMMISRVSVFFHDDNIMMNCKWFVKWWWLLELVLEQEKVVGGCNCDHIFRRVPGRVKNLFVKVKAVDVNLVLLALSSGAHLSRLQHCFGLRDFSGGFEGDFFSRVSIEHAEKVVVGAGHDGAVVAVPATLELVENTIVFIERTQLRSQILVNRVRFNGLGFHV